MANEPPRILLAEDDRDLLELTSAILGQQAAVACASEPGEALRLIASREFDVLMTDLDMVRPCDGLILAGAMRYLHPKARTVLVTGFPDFTRAMASMQALLDVTILKPVPVQVLQDLSHREEHPARQEQGLGKLRLWKLLERHKSDILGAWLRLVEQDSGMGALPLSPTERMDHMVEVLDELAGHGTGPMDATAHAARHGHTRRAQGYKSEWVATEMSYLRRTVYEYLLRDLLEMDLSCMVEDLMSFDIHLDRDLLCSLQAFGLLG